MRRGCVLLGLSIAVGLTFAAMARQGHPPPGFPCKAFAKSEQGDWIPVRDVRLRGPGGSVIGGGRDGSGGGTGGVPGGGIGCGPWARM